MKTIVAVAAALLTFSAVQAGAEGKGKGEFREVIKAQREATKPLRRELRDALAELADRVEDKASDKALLASLDRVEKARKALRAEREKLHEKLAASMTPAERARLTLRLAQRHGRRGFGRHPGRGHPGR